MTVHFLHIGKTGGSSIKRALRDNELAYWRPEARHKVPETPYGRIMLHRHRFRLEDVPPDDYVFFFVRDPIARFVSGFYSRLNKGQPLHYREWSPGERTSFEAFPTPQRLAAALAGDDAGERELAERAMRQIQHLRFMRRRLGPPDAVRARFDQIVYIGRQETLDADWRNIKSILHLPDVELPSDPVAAHRGDPSRDTSLDRSAVRALRDWYARDYRLVECCDEIRAERGWGPRLPIGHAARKRVRAVRAALR